MNKKKVVSTVIDEETYLLLKKKSELKGYRLVSDYVRYLIEKDIGEDSGSDKVEISNIDSLVDIIEKRLNRIERIVSDLLNPYTGKVDKIIGMLTEISESISDLSEEIRSLETARSTEQRGELSVKKPLVSYKKEQPVPRRSAIDRLKEEGVVFESDLDWLKRPDLFFGKLEREGAIVFETDKGRVAIDPDFLEELKVKLREINIPEAEAVENLLRPQESRLFRLLVESGRAYYDSVEGGWYIEI